MRRSNGLINVKFASPHFGPEQEVQQEPIRFCERRDLVPIQRRRGLPSYNAPSAVPVSGNHAFQQQG